MISSSFADQADGAAGEVATTAASAGHIKRQWHHPSSKLRQNRESRGIRLERLLGKKRKVPKNPPPKALKDILAEGCALNKERGWRARQLGFPRGKVGRLKEFRNDFLMDLTELRGFRSALPITETRHCARGNNGKFLKSKSMKQDPFSISYLNYAWGVGKNYANKILNPKPPKERMKQIRQGK